jgi:hypothetical protein
MNETPRELTDAELEVVTGAGLSVMAVLLGATYLAVWQGMVDGQWLAEKWLGK